MGQCNKKILYVIPDSILTMLFFVVVISKSFITKLVHKEQKIMNKPLNGVVLPNKYIEIAMDKTVTNNKKIFFTLIPNKEFGVRIEATPCI